MIEVTIVYMGGATFLKVGVYVRERSERKIFFDPPPMAYLGGT